MLLGLLNRKISTKVGLIVILLVAVLAGWLMIRQYIAFMEMRFESLEIFVEE